MGGTARLAGVVNSTWQGTLDDAPIFELRQALASCGYVRVRGVCSRAQIDAGLTRLRQSFDRRDDHPTIGEAPSEVRTNFQKLSIGTARGPHRVGEPFARLLRVLFNPLIAGDTYGLHGVFRTAARLRNRMLGLPEEFALASIDGGLFTASRVQQYPSGGGFLAPHRDHTSAANIESLIPRYLQLVIVLTERGIDFERGGAFVEADGNRVDLEDGAEVGDILMYDGSLTHGVDDIDPHILLDLDSLNGRLAGFVTLYKSM